MIIVGLRIITTNIKKIVKTPIESSIERHFFSNFIGIFASILEILTKLIKYLGLSNRTNDEKFYQQFSCRWSFQ
jgi:hypothetical protein